MHGAILLCKSIKEVMSNGTVKFFSIAKGFGFITPDGGGKDVFVPAASITAAKITDLKAGQRVSFDEAPDGKGPKAVNLVLLEMPKAPEPAKPRPPTEAKHPLTLYWDGAFEGVEDLLDAIRAAGHEPRLVDYVATPLTRDELKALSALLRGTDQSLVKRHEHMFRELRLDDRFIGENDFWDAIVEHPVLINGPVVASAARAGIVRSPEVLKAFLAAVASNDAPVAKRKTLSPALLKLMMSATPAAAAPRKSEGAVMEMERARVVETAPSPEPKASVKLKIEIRHRPKVEPTVEVKAQPKLVPKALPKTKPVAKAKAKPAPKAKPPVKAAKPAGKPKRR